MTREKNKKQANVRTNPDRIASVTASPLGDLIEKNAKDDYRNKAKRSGYINRKAWQMFTGAAEPEQYMTRPMWKGIEREPVIKDFYTKLTGVEIIDPEFRLHQDMKMFGASPDGIFADNPAVLVECKHMEASTMTDMIENRVISYRHRIQMTAQIAVFKDRGARVCEYIFANLDDEQGECITDFNLLEEGRIQSIRFEPTDDEILEVLQEVQILITAISEKAIALNNRSVPLNVN